jgi:glutathione synthase/RimK-type ligase-like ATP-grasp enzyme
LVGNIINPLPAEFAADRKPLQLHHATKIGLRIPDTIITNSPEEATAFLRQRKAGAIFKILTNTPWQLTETREFKPEYFEHIRGLKMAPAIFQEKIKSKKDIRVTIVDNAVFAVSIQATHQLAKLDWRLDLKPKIIPHNLPKDLQKKLVKLLRALGLRFGAIDLGLTHQNDYVFYKINPAGQFLFCEAHGDQKISSALAAALLREA